MSGESERKPPGAESRSTGTAGLWATAAPPAAPPPGSEPGSQEQSATGLRPPRRPVSPWEARRMQLGGGGALGREAGAIWEARAGGGAAAQQTPTVVSSLAGGGGGLIKESFLLFLH